MGKDRAPARPNILVVMFDQLTPSALGLLRQSRRRTRRHSTGWPARASCSMRRTRNSPLCTPARYCMMTGQLPSAHRRLRQRRLARQHRSRRSRTTLRARPATARCSAGKMHFVGPDQLHGFEERRTTDIYPADFGWTPDWRAARRADRLVVPQHGLASRRRASPRSPTSCASTTRSAYQARRALHDLARDRRPAAVAARASASPIPHDPYVTRAATGTATTGREIPMPRVPQTTPSRPAHRAAARRRATGRGRRSARARRAPRAARLLRQRSPTSTSWIGPARSARSTRLGLRRRHGRAVRRRPRRHARRARALVQDELLRGLCADPADRPARRAGSRPGGSRRRSRWSTCCRRSPTWSATSHPASSMRRSAARCSTCARTALGTVGRPSARSSASTWRRARSRRS